MTSYQIEYTNAISKKPDHVTINVGDQFEFETGFEKVTNIIDAINIFEIIAAKYWGTFETKATITNIKVIES